MVYTMDISTIQYYIMPIIVLGFGLFSGFMYLYRNMTAGESFDLTKFFPTMGLGATAALVFWLATGALPSIAEIFVQIEILAPGGVMSMPAIIAALLAILNGLSKLGQGNAVAASLVGSKVVAATTTVTSPVGQRVKMADGRYAVVNGDGTFTYDDGSIINCNGEVVKPAIPVAVTDSAEPVTGTTPPEPVTSNSLGPGYIASGFKVDPSDNKGLSPFTPELRIEVGMSRDGKTRPVVHIDWNDGSPAEQYIPRPADGVAWVKHTYTYVKGKEDKYYSKQYYPTFHVIDAIDGRVETYNLMKRCCWITVESPGAQPQ